METSEARCLYLGIKVNLGPLERHRLENYSLENTVESLKQEASTRAKMDTDALELIHHGRILDDLAATLAASGIREGEMVHVLKKERSANNDEEAPTYTVADLQQIVTSLRGFGCTPTAPGWTRAMQVLNDDERLGELLEAVPGLRDDCSSLSILHEIELLAALGATISTMKRGAAALPPLPAALKHLTKMVNAHPPPSSSYTAPTSGFAYSLEALSEDEDGDEEDEEGTSRPPIITQEQLASALGMATSASGHPVNTDHSRNSNLLQLLRHWTDVSGGNGADDGSGPGAPGSSNGGGGRNIITEDMFSTAVSEALSRANRSSTSAAATTDSPMDQGVSASSSQGATTPNPDDYSTRLQHMHEMGLLDDAVNLHALLVCNGDVNAAINFVFTSMEE